MKIELSKLETNLIIACLKNIVLSLEAAKNQALKVGKQLSQDQFMTEPVLLMAPLLIKKLELELEKEKN